MFDFEYDGKSGYIVLHGFKMSINEFIEISKNRGYKVKEHVEIVAVKCDKCNEGLIDKKVMTTLIDGHGTQLCFRQEMDEE